MEIQIHINSIFSSVCYRVLRVLVDPGDVWEGFKSVSIVLLTHAHFDHIYGLNDVMRVSPGALVYTNGAGREMLLDARKNLSFYYESPFVFERPEQIRVVNDGDEVALGNDLIAKAVFTPGHNPSCITWLIGDMVFSGDSLIPGVKTVANLPGGNRRQAEESEGLIRQLSACRSIYPGHSI